jgi:hypothetical protein
VGAPEGARDKLFGDCEARRALEGSARTLFARFGYAEMMTPTLERGELFERAGLPLPPENLCRFVGRDGAVVNEGFRVGGRLERLGTRSGLFRIAGDFRGPGLEEPFAQGSLSLYFRPSSQARKKNALPQGFSRISLSLRRDGRTREKTRDIAEASVAFNLGPLRTAFSGSYTTLTVFDPEDAPFPLPLPPAFEAYNSAKTTGEISWSPGIFQFRTRLGYTMQKEKESLWDASFYSSAKIGKHNRLSLKIAAPVFPREWNYTFTWRFEMR